jgi:hypothetical protein
MRVARSLIRSRAFTSHQASRIPKRAPRRWNAGGHTFMPGFPGRSLVWSSGAPTMTKRLRGRRSRGQSVIEGRVSASDLWLPPRKSARRSGGGHLRRRLSEYSRLIVPVDPEPSGHPEAAQSRCTALGGWSPSSPF